MHHTMSERDYQFWVDWKLGLITKELTIEEKSNIRNCEFAMNFLVSKQIAAILLDKHGKTLIFNKTLLTIMAESLAVPYEVLVFQLHDVQIEREREEKRKSFK